MRCPHCGQAHGPGFTQCPLTGESMANKGLIGTRVDRYQIDRLLGVGGFGAVYLARHVHTDAIVALKLLKRALNADQSMIDRFMREAKAAQAVASEQIVRVLDAGISADGQSFLALEYLEGVDLKDLISRDGPQPVVRLVMLTLQVLEGLAAAHSKGIVHRDMKPANVFVLRRKTPGGGEVDFVKLLDFGISKMHAEGTQAALTMTGMAIGTPGYMAPEQFFDARNVDARADLYSVAVMLYELLSRRLPHEATSYAELIVKVRTETPPPLLSVAPHAGAALAAVVDRGLSREPAARYASARDMADALRAALSAPVTNSMATPMPQFTPGVRPDPMSQSMLSGKTAPPRMTDLAAAAAAVPAPRPSTPGYVSGAPNPVPAVSMASAPSPVQPPAVPTPTPGWVASTPTASAPSPKKGLSTWVILTIIGLIMVFGCCGTLGFIGYLNEAGKMVPPEAPTAPESPAPAE